MSHKRNKKMLSWRGQCLVKELLEGDLNRGLASWQIDIIADVFNAKRFTLRELNKIEAIHKEAKDKGLMPKGIL